jgi:UDP-2,3-diacylglucosamine hydrolase
VTTLILSDLHLDEARPSMLDAFERLMRKAAVEAATVFILGDLFEAWIGDDDDRELGARVAGAIGGATGAGCKVSFVHGNRDFLLGESFAARCGMTLLTEESVAMVEGRPVLLLHGDTLCLHDRAYATFRQQVRNPGWQKAFLASPLAERRAFAASARAESSRYTADAAPVLMDVDPTEVAQRFEQLSVDTIIHGHTHRPAIHSLQAKGRVLQRIVLPDWYSRAGYLRADADRLALIDA